jgi:hypothetical protein
MGCCLGSILKLVFWLVLLSLFLSRNSDAWTLLILIGFVWVLWRILFRPAR